jgi:hypothetical protein
MPTIWRPDTCNCIILYDQPSATVLNEITTKPKKSKPKTFKTIPCKIHEEIILTDLLQFCINENQSANEFYKNWTEEDFKDPESYKLIDEYKKVFVEVPSLEPIRNLSFIESKTELRG